MSAWTVSAVVRAYRGGPAIIGPKTIANGGVTVSSAATGVFVISLAAADLALQPGLYTWEFDRTNSGFFFPIVDPSALLVRGDTAGAYPTLTNMSAFLAATGQSDTIGDAAAKQLVFHQGAVEDAFKRWCGREFTYGTYTEYLSPNWQQAVAVRETPVESVTGVYFDLGAAGGQNAADFDATTLQTLGTDYFLHRDRPTDTYSNSGLIYRVGGVWSGARSRPVDYLAYRQVPAVNTLKVTYTAGYGNAIKVPYDLLNGIHEATLLLKAAAEMGRLKQSESGEGYSYSLGPLEDEIRRLASTQQVLAAYRRGSTFVR